MKHALEILAGIASKGGLIGKAAKLYMNDEQKAHQFVLECFGQVHNESARKLWGDRLVKDITDYRNSLVDEHV